jgi:hypothetical protein
VLEDVRNVFPECSACDKGFTKDNRAYWCEACERYLCGQCTVNYTCRPCMEEARAARDSRDVQEERALFAWAMAHCKGCGATEAEVMQDAAQDDKADTGVRCSICEEWFCAACEATALCRCGRS